MTKILVYWGKGIREGCSGMTLNQLESFLVLAQKGGGTSLAEKRGICRLFTRSWASSCFTAVPAA